MNKKNLVVLTGAIFIALSVGVIYEKFLSNFFQEKLESILADLKPDPVGYQGTAKIEAIRAYLFYDHTGEISGNILAKKDLTLWNTPIGEGDAGANSNTTLIAVEISGQDSHAKVNVIVTDEDKKQLINETRSFWIFNNDRKFYMPFMLPSSGCKKITISAKLIGKGFSSSAISQTIPFECGE